VKLSSSTFNPNISKPAASTRLNLERARRGEPAFASALIDDEIRGATCPASVFIFLDTTRDPCAQEALANRYAASLTIVAHAHCDMRLSQG
jgi:hypothetical protein